MLICSSLDQLHAFKQARAQVLANWYAADCQGEATCTAKFLADADIWGVYIKSRLGHNSLNQYPTMEASKPASNPFEKIFHYGFVDPGQNFRMLLNHHGR